jgi:hypothetical protein
VVGPDNLWQLHYAVDSGPTHNVDEKYIANPDENHDAARDIKALANADGTFLIVNSRNDARMKYGAKVGN